MESAHYEATCSHSQVHEQACEFAFRFIIVPKPKATKVPRIPPLKKEDQIWLDNLLKKKRKL